MGLFDSMTPEGWLAFASQVAQPSATRGSPIGSLANAYMVGGQASNAAQQQAILRQKQQMEMEELQRVRAEQERGRQAMAEYRPSGATPFENLLNQARFFESKGMLKEAQQAMTMAEKFKPKFKTDIRTEIVDGKPVSVQYGEGGERQVVQGGTPYERPMEVNMGGSVGIFNPLTQSMGPTFGKTQSPDSAASVAATIRGQNMTDARAREANDINRAASRSQIINDPNLGPIVVDKGTNRASPVMMGGQPVPSESAIKTQKGAKDILALLDEADKYIDSATGSYLGTGADLAARAVGWGTQGAQDIGRLKAIEGALLSKMPRMEGSQSNYDVQMYRQAVGQIGDPTVPTSIKKAAVETVREIQQRYSGGSAAAPKAPFRVPTIEEVTAEMRRRGL